MGNERTLSSYPDGSVFLFTCSCGFEKEAGKKQLVSVYGVLNDIESVSRHTARFIGGCDREYCCVTCEVFEDDEAVAGMAGRRETMNGTGCQKCGGAGWLWWYELDDYDGPAIQTGADDTRYSCDGEVHRERKRTPRKETERERQ